MLNELNVNDVLVTKLTSETHEDEVLSPEEFSINIELKAQSEHLSLLESLMDIMSDNEMDFGDIKGLLTPAFKKKLAKENYIVLGQKKTGILPVL